MRNSHRLAIISMIVLFGLPVQAGMLNLSFENLMPLDEAQDGLYEGWAIIDGAPISTGVFNVDGAGNVVTPGTGELIDYFQVDADLEMASAIKISLEPVDDGDPGPSGLIVLTGDLTGDEMVYLNAALPGLDMLPGATGEYILATPSDNDHDDMNDDQGIWWLTVPGPVAGLNGLPDLGPNWIYEGWVVDVSGGSPIPYSTGTFTSGEGFDSDMAGCMGGGPPFPGQDFVEYQCDPVLDLDSGAFAAVISIEPVPDNGPGPFQFKPLAGMIAMGVLKDRAAVNNQVDETFPTGVALIDGMTATVDTNWSQIKGLYR